MAENDVVYTCDDCKRAVYLLAPGTREALECCEKPMREMTEKEKEPYHPRFPKPGSP